MPEVPDSLELKYVMMKLTIKEASLIHRMRKYPYAKITVQKAKGQPQFLDAQVQELLTDKDITEIMGDPDNAKATQQLLTKSLF